MNISCCWLFYAVFCVFATKGECLLFIVLPTNCFSLSGKHLPVMPLYLSELISHYLPSQSLRSSNRGLLTRPYGITSNFYSLAFSVLHLLLGTLCLSRPYPPLNVTKNSISSSLPLSSSQPAPAPPRFIFTIFG